VTALYIILISAGVSAALSVLLATLLIVAERYLVNYGQCKIDVNQGAKEFDVRGGESLLAVLRNENIFIPSACGGRGTCAYCKCKISAGGGPLSPTETPLLSEEEIAKDIRISCQVKVREDVKLEIPEELLLVQEFTAEVERIRDLTHDIKELRLKLIDPPRIEFTPGHYVQLEAPAYEGNPEPVFRAYSISSPPEDAEHLELIVRLVPGGICTTWVFQHLSEGDEVHFTGPYGEFRLSETDAPMVWIAGGSGMAPFWSLLRHMKTHGIERQTRYFFGAVSKRDMFFLDEMKQLEEELSWFRFIPALSGDEPEGEWDGERGLITEVVGRHVDSGDGLEAYLCGSPGMIDASIAVLHEKGIPDERIYFDKFA